VAGDVEGPGALIAQLEAPVTQPGRARPGRKGREKRLRQEVLVDVDARYLPIMRVTRLRSESPSRKVVIAYPDMVLPLWR
jgi:hypothetical protein